MSIKRNVRITTITSLVLLAIIGMLAIMGLSGLNTKLGRSITILIAGSTLIMLAVMLIYSISIEKQRLKETIEVYQKLIEKTNGDRNGHKNRHENSPSNTATAASLTGLQDKQCFQKKLDEEIIRAQRQRIPLFLAMFDIDNETLPKNVLNIVGNVIANNIRDKIDTGFHYEDKKFAIILPFTIKDHAVTVTKRILQGLNSWEITASMGLISCNEIGTSNAYELIKITELAISEAKAEGGNRIRLLEKSSSSQTELTVPKRNKIKHLKLLK